MFYLVFVIFIGLYCQTAEANVPNLRKKGILKEPGPTPKPGFHQLFAKIYSIEMGKDLRFCLGNVVSHWYILAGFNCMSVVSLSTIFASIYSEGQKLERREVSDILKNPDRNSALMLIKLYQRVNFKFYTCLSSQPLPKFGPFTVVGLSPQEQLETLEFDNARSQAACGKYLYMQLQNNTLCSIVDNSISTRFHYDTLLFGKRLLGTFWLYRFGIQSVFLYESVGTSLPWISSIIKDPVCYG